MSTELCTFQPTLKNRIKHMKNILLALLSITTPAIGQSLPFEAVFDTGTNLTVADALTVSDIDKDGFLDIIVANQKSLWIYEATGDNNYVNVHQTDVADVPVGIHLGLGHGDTDGDGLLEIISQDTIGSIRIYESSGVDNYTYLGVMFLENPAGHSSIAGRQIIVADTDGDGLQEIIFFHGSVGSSKVFIYEHDGVIGVNSYTKKFEYSTITLIFRISVGDSDNDGNLEIILGLGGSGGNPAVIRRIENTGPDSWVHKCYGCNAPFLPIGLNTGYISADIDNDGLEELIAQGGSPVPFEGGMRIYDSPSNDTYQLIHEVGGFDGGTTSISVISEEYCSLYKSFVLGATGAGAFAVGKDIWTFRYDGSNYITEGMFVNTGSSREVVYDYLDNDLTPDIVTLSRGTGPTVQQLVFFEQVGPEVPSNYCVGKVNSQSCLPFITTKGIPSMTSLEPFWLEGRNIINQQPGILMYSDTLASIPFEGGTLCVGVPIVRTDPVSSGGTSLPAVDCTGKLLFDMMDEIQNSGEPILFIGNTLYTQWWYRDPASPSGTGLTDAVQFLICP